MDYYSNFQKSTIESGCDTLNNEKRWKSFAVLFSRFISLILLVDASEVFECVQLQQRNTENHEEKSTSSILVWVLRF